MPPHHLLKRFPRLFIPHLPLRALSTSRAHVPLHMAIIGAGPAGFYTAYRVLSKLPTAQIDMYEALPVPYGLVRFGVAPDHLEVKNCTDKFAEVASHPNFRYLGNTPIGLPEEKGKLPLSSLVPHYHALLLSYGASKDKKLNIPGEDTLGGIYSARDFVGWYNGNPENRNLNPCLEDAEEAVVIGQGNVALDVARMLLGGVDRLRGTDVAEYALERLGRSRVKRVRVVGRRGPLQASFTLKELRELLHLPHTHFHALSPTLLPPPSLTPTFPRPQKRLLELLHQHTTPNPTPNPPQKSWSLDFLLTPTHFHTTPPSTHLTQIHFQHTLLPPPPHGYSPTAPTTLSQAHTALPAQLALKSIGYLSLPLPGAASFGIPFNPKQGLVPNENGRVVIPQELGAGESFKEIGTIRVPGVYAAGWVKRGPTGVIASTMFDAFETGDMIVEDWVSGKEFMDYVDGEGGEGGKKGWEAIEGEARRKGVRSVAWEEWLRIEKAERERGRARGKEREKFASVEEMLEVLE